MKCKSLIILLSLLSLFCPNPPPARAADVRLSVAASMTDAFKALAAAFDTNHPGITVLPNFGSSGALAKQIVLGAPADLFISANPKWMDYLVREKEISPATVRIFAYNTLVVVGRQTTPITSLADLIKFDRIAIGSPGSVPAGQYAEQAMRAAGVYEKLLKLDKLVMAKDVRQALIYADRGEVTGAFVYRTDALLAKKAAILYRVPEHLHDRIAYPLGLTTAGEANGAAKTFYAYMASPAAIKILKKYGFKAVGMPNHGPPKKQLR